jgi:hypothetical protein
MTASVTHLVIARACDTDPDGPNAEARIGHVEEPSPEVLADYTLHVADMFKQAFGREPARVAVAVLPWSAAEDKDKGDLRSLGVRAEGSERLPQPKRRPYHIAGYDSPRRA